MKLTKRLTAIAACACMAMTSMVGMVASAGYSTTLLEPSGNPYQVTIKGINYGFQVMSAVETGTLSDGRITGKATTSLYEVNGNSIPLGNISLQTYLYAKGKNNQTVIIDGSYDILTNPNSSSCVFAVSDKRNDYTCYAAGGYASIRASTYDPYVTISSGETAYIS